MRRIQYSLVGIIVTTVAASVFQPIDGSPKNEAARTIRRRFRLPGRTWELDFDDDQDDLPNTDTDSSSVPLLFGSGREFRIFGAPSSKLFPPSLDGDDNNDDDNNSDESDESDDDLERRNNQDYSFPKPRSETSWRTAEHVHSNIGRNDPHSSAYHRAQFASTPSSSSSNNSNLAHPSSSPFPSDYYKSYYRRPSKHTWAFFQPVSDWWTTNITPSIKTWPKIQCRVEPTTTLKIRKTFRPLGTIVRIGANFNTQLGVWQFKSSWEDAIIGGKLTLAGRELQLTKSWPLSVGAVEDLVTRLRLRAAVDLSTWKAYVRVGFRTERLSPINVMEGFTLQRQVPLDGPRGHVKLQVKANFALPEPEVEYSTESSQRSLIGMGDIQINIEELNLLLDY